MKKQDFVNADQIKDFVAAQVKLTGLQTELAKVIDGIDSINQVLSQEGKRSDTVTDAANRLLSGDTGSVPAHPDSQLHTKLDTLRDRRRVMSRAIELQKDNINKLQAAASAFVEKETRPDYVRTVKKLAESVAKLSKCVEEEQKHRLLFDSLGLHYYRNPAVFPRIGTLSDSASQANYFLNELVKSGYLTKSEIESIKSAA